MSRSCSSVIPQVAGISLNKELHALVRTPNAGFVTYLILPQEGFAKEGKSLEKRYRSKKKKEKRVVPHLPACRPQLFLSTARLDGSDSSPHHSTKGAKKPPLDIARGTLLDTRTTVPAPLAFLHRVDWPCRLYSSTTSALVFLCCCTSAIEFPSGFVSFDLQLFHDINGLYLYTLLPRLLIPDRKATLA